MAAAELIATAATAATSSDTVIADGVSVTFSLKEAAANAQVIIELKADAAVGYIPVGQITQDDPVKIVTGPGTYRTRRVAGASCGVFSG